MKKGLFVVIEGPEGSGKTTQAELLCRYLAQKGYETLCVREPGGTEVGQRLREILKDKSLSLEAETELLLFAASRAQLIKSIIRPALQAGKAVVSDRFTLSTEVYQGFAQGISQEFIKQLNRFCLGDVEPDITFVLILNTNDALKKRLGVKSTDSSQEFLFPKTQPDRIERKSTDFHKKVYEGYKKLSKNRPKTVIIDGKGEIETVHRRIVNELEKILS
ncbi:MAG: dTMP kinase [Planctomycetota bacterium]|nr:dTMP kinase [Planctomycetota bacterium]